VFESNHDGDGPERPVLVSGPAQEPTFWAFWNTPAEGTSCSLRSPRNDIEKGWEHAQSCISKQTFPKPTAYPHPRPRLWRLSGPAGGRIRRHIPHHRFACTTTIRDHPIIIGCTRSNVRSCRPPPQQPLFYLKKAWQATPAFPTPPSRPQPHLYATRFITPSTTTRNRIVDTQDFLASRVYITTIL
jgi:hypothetical protein